mmetsp:Transcript_11058/g.41298  ORF Transcript_11058/g.41298 Transcript_11058/m.41298 type:complete len:204 (-) Transcript_11058:2576-3187(-)
MVVGLSGGMRVAEHSSCDSKVAREGFQKVQTKMVVQSAASPPSSLHCAFAASVALGARLWVETILPPFARDRSPLSGSPESVILRRWTPVTTRPFEKSLPSSGVKMSPCVKLLSKESGTVIRPRRNASSTDRPRPSVNASELSSTSESNAASAPSSFAADVTELPSTELSKESDAIFAVMIDSDASPATRSTERSFWICPMMR